MVDEITSIANAYDIEVEEERSPDITTFTLTSNSGTTPKVITVQYVKDRIYSVKFLNNDFFELPDEELLNVLNLILQGQYEIKTSKFRKIKSVVVKSGSGDIFPERVSDDKLENYERLPESFPLKK